MDLETALKIVTAGGYRVTKPRAKPVDASRVGPSCVVKFADGEVCRMSTWTRRDKLDWTRGIKLCSDAWRTRQFRKSNYLPDQPVPAILSCHFEDDGTVIGIYQAAVGVAA
jgi:hypothetical protein